MHTFYGSCSQSDGVEDTAPERSAHYGCTNPGTRDTCPGDSRVDPVFNFMDYSDDVCMFEFTAGQKLVMQACWDIYRLGNDSNRPLLDLALGRASSRLNLAPGERQTYFMSIAGVNKAIECLLLGNEGNADLYVDVNAAPRFDGPDCCNSSLANSDESCIIPTQGSSSVTPTTPLRRFLCGLPIIRRFCRTQNKCGTSASGDRAAQALSVICSAL